MSTDQNTAVTTDASGSAHPSTGAGVSKASKRPRKRLSPAEIARKRERQLPAIARTPADHPASPAQAAQTVREVEAMPVTVIGDASDELVLASSFAPSVAPTAEPSDGPIGRPVDVRVEAAVELLDEPVLDRDPAPATTMWQPTLWEGNEDPAVVEEWVAATAIVYPIIDDEATSDASAASAVDTENTVARAGEAGRRIQSVADVVDQVERRATLSTLTVQHHAHLVPQVRAAVVDLVMEHRHVSVEADKHMTWLGIRFGIWSLTKTADGVFNPYRDLTEDRISGYLRYLGSSVSEASKDSYGSGLRRLAAGPPQRRVGKRRVAVAPHTRGAEDGFWTAADAYHPHSLEHTEAKTLFAANFGAGALPEEVNVLAPGDVLAAGGRVSLRLTRDATDSRVVPVAEDRYAHWLADRAAQLRGERYLFQPGRASRRNAVNATTRRLRESNAIFERYSTSAARNAWFARLLSAGIPFQVACVVAGISVGTHLPTDMLPHLPVPDPADIEAVIRARLTPPQTP